MLRGDTLARVGWYDYVRQVSDGDSNERIAARIGVTGATVGRWKFRDPNPKDVAAFAREYGRPPLEAIIEAGFIGREDASAPLPARPDPGQLTNEELIAEVVRRMQPDGTDAEGVAYSDRLTRKQAQQEARRTPRD